MIRRHKRRFQRQLEQAIGAQFADRLAGQGHAATLTMRISGGGIIATKPLHCPLQQSHGPPFVVKAFRLELGLLLGVKFKKDVRGQFAHSNIITRLDAQGEIVFRQTGLNRTTDQMVVAVEKLFQAADK
jgi:hypothetical protein